MLHGDIMILDHKDDPVVVPVLNSYAEGMDPAEYWATSYGTRKAYLAVKQATGKAGFMAKQLTAAAHKGVITEDDCGTERGISVKSDDEDNVGAVLAQPNGKMARNTLIDEDAMDKLQGEEIVVRSPITCEAPEGLCAKCAGARSSGRLPSIGDNIGIEASMGLAEPLSQSMLGAKHGGGVAGGDTGVSGFDYINQILQVPKVFKDRAVLSQLSGKVNKITKPEYGGHIVHIGETEHYVQPGQDLKVKVGDDVDDGDELSTGVPNPAEVTRLRGVGSGRMKLLDLMRRGYQDSGLPVNRRNVEVIARYAINHALVNKDFDGHSVNDIVSFNRLQRDYKPRQGAEESTLTGALTGRYLEAPVMHYTVGTKITRSIVKDLKKNKVSKVLTHHEEPPFDAQNIRLMENQAMADDFLTRMGGWYTRRGFEEAVRAGTPSQKQSESFIPGLVTMEGFGEKLKTKGIY